MRVPLGRSRIFLLFFLSGISGLMYEVVWLRMLARMLGVTIYATATVVAAFMAGLALGSFFLGRRIDREKQPLRIYALLELSIGLAALLITVALQASVPLYRTLYEIAGAGAPAIRVAFAFLALLVPTIMMGGTLPVLTSYLVRTDSGVGRNFSLLYGINTFGAVAGVVLAGFLTIGAFGERATIVMGALLNMGVAALAFLIAARDRAALNGAAHEARPEAAADPVSLYGAPIRRLVLVAYALSGFTALAYEVIWTRQLILFLRTSIYAFSGMLAVFLAGIALGSLLLRRRVDRLRTPLVVFAALETVVGILSVVNLYLFAPLDGELARSVLGIARVGIATMVIVLPLTLLFGMITPVASVCYTERADSAGDSIGRLYSANTVGSILGSLAAGFLLIPRLGATQAVLLLALVNVALGAALFRAEPRRTRGRRWTYAVAALPLVLLLVAASRPTDPFRSTIERRIDARIGTSWIPGAYLALPRSHHVYYYHEGVEGTLTAFEVNHFKQLWINGVGMTFLNTETKGMAYLPLFFANRPKQFLAIAFGMGTSTRSAAVAQATGLYPDLEITAVDLVPETFKAFHYYHADGDEILHRPNVHTVVNDGRNFLLLTDRRYDVVTIDPAPPIWSAGTVNLYTREFFALVRSRLTPDGTFCLWFPEGTREEVASMVRTFVDVFPNAAVLSGPHGWGFYLLGPKRRLDWTRFSEQSARAYENPRIVADITEFDDALSRPGDLPRLLMWDADGLRRLGRDGVLITDDHPFTEFPLWRYLRNGREVWHPRSTWLADTQRR